MSDLDALAACIDAAERGVMLDQETVRRAREYVHEAEVGRDYARRAIQLMLDNIRRPDPCHSPARCDEAQTCVGGCAYVR